MKAKNLFYDVFMYFLKQSFGGMDLQWNLPRFIKNILICVLKTNESLKGF